MLEGGREYTLYFAWTPADTPWDISLARFDEDVFDLVMEHDEGQIPTCTIEVINPRIGFIAPGRLYWAWISYSVDACGPTPLFFGRLLGTPEEIITNVVRMKFVTRDTDYIQQKQQVAETLKILPNYDAIFFDVLKRDDPDAILEGWSYLYHVDRLSGAVSVSEILIGEDGTVNFAAPDVFYDSVQIKPLQSPLVAVNVKMEVQWEQQYIGYFPLGMWAYPTLGGDAFVGDWPKTGNGLGGGWFAGASWAGERDPDPATAMLQTAVSTVVPLNFKWTNQEKTHEDGDTMSVSINYQPASPGFTSILLKWVSISGALDPFAVDDDGNPAPINIPAFDSMDWLTYRTFALDFQGKESFATLSLTYSANRKRSERLDMTVKAGVQPLLIDPLVTEDTEQIELKSGDLSLPLVDLLNWSSVAGAEVARGQIIFPDNPLVPGQTSSQIAVVPGIAGTTEPIFSNIAGQETADGEVVWASLGATPPTEAANDWSPSANVSPGTLLFPKPVSGVGDVASLTAAGALTYPPMGVAIAQYTILTSGHGGPGAPMMECTAAGILGGLSGAGPPAFHGFTNADGKYVYIATVGGQTGQYHSSFIGNTVVDGSVTWVPVGPANLPIGGWGGATPARTYFQTARGQQSLLHGACRARAKLRRRARAVQVSFDTRFEVAALLSCRMNGRVSDQRLPGGTVSGKVISYKIEAHGSTGEWIGRVVLGCSIGTEVIGATRSGGAYTDPGIPCYVGVAGATNGYVRRGYQRYLSSDAHLPPGTLAQQGVAFPPPALPPDWPLVPPTIPPSVCLPPHSTWSAGPTDPGGEEIGYTPPSGQPNDDGIIFPASPSQVVIKAMWHGIASTLNPNNIQAYNDLIFTTISDAIIAFDRSAGVPVPLKPFTVIPGVNWVDLWNAVQQAILKSVMQGEGLWFELVLRPLTNGPFANAYVIQSVPLLIPQTINLSAPSTGFFRIGRREDASVRSP